jgi:hypothetical protein
MKGEQAEFRGNISLKKKKLILARFVPVGRSSLHEAGEDENCIIFRKSFLHQPLLSR